MGSPGVLKEPRPLFKPGDLVEAEVEGIGVLRNPVATARACNTRVKRPSQGVVAAETTAAN
jgi:hypothetical protein